MIQQQRQQQRDEEDDDDSRTDTSNNTSSPDDNSVRLCLATTALCSCMLIHAYVLISVYPYAALMAVDLLSPSITPENAGTYSGLLASAFMFGRMLSSYPWGVLADVYGRRFVLLSSLTLSAVFSLLFGMSQSFAVAMSTRFILGLTNGLVGTVKTVVSELAPSEEIEAKMMGMVVGMRSWGFLISPAIGGWLSEPIRQYPSIFADTDASAWWYSMMSEYPFILPNLVGSTLCIGTALIALWCIPETLPRRPTSSDVENSTVDQNGLSVRKYCCVDNNHRWCLRRRSSRVSSGESQNVTEQSSLLVPPRNSKSKNDETPSSHESTSIDKIWQIELARNHLIPYWLFSFAVSALDEAFPLFCIAATASGGLGVPEKVIGQVLSISGLVFASLQYLVYVRTVEFIGLYKSLWVGCSMGFIPVFFLPLTVALQTSSTKNDDREEGFPRLSLSAFLVLVILLALSKIFCCMFFASMSIALNKTVKTEQRASLNGFSTFGGSVFKGLGPILAGMLAAGCFSSHLFASYSSVVLFSCIGLAGLSVDRFLLNLNVRNEV